METLEVLPSSDDADKKHLGSKQQHLDWTFVSDGDVLSRDDFLHFSLNDVTASVDLPMVSSVTDSGLEEMLQNGSPELQTKDTSCTLAQLLTSASPNTMPLTSISHASKMPLVPDSIMIEGERFNNGVVLPSSGQMVSEHTLSTAGTLVQILQKGSPMVSSQSTSSDYQTTLPFVSLTDLSICNANNNNNNNKMEFSMAAVTRTISDSDRPDAMAIALAEDNGLFPNLEDNTMPLLNGDDSNISLDNGIEAMDMCSLLEQFEAVENFTSLSDDLMLSAPPDSSSIIKLKEDVDLLGQDQLQLFSPSHCQIIQDDQESTEMGQSRLIPRQTPVVSSDSEVMKLLKAPHITVPRMARNRAVEQGIPKSASASTVDVTQKNKMRTKSKSTILLADNAIPPMGNRSNPASTDTGKGSTIRKLLRGSVDHGTSSPAASPSRKPVKRLNLSQYRQRTKQHNIGSSEDSNDSCSSSIQDDNKNNLNISSNYFDAITDHDYCQNIPSCKATAGDKTKKSVKNVSPPPDDPNCMLKSLLLNKNLSEELKEQAIKDRAVTQRNMRTAGISHQHLEPAPLAESSLLSSTSLSSPSSPSSSSLVSTVCEISKNSVSGSHSKPKKSCTQISNIHRDVEPALQEARVFEQVSQDRQKSEMIPPEEPKSQHSSPDRHKSRDFSPQQPTSQHVSPDRQKASQVSQCESLSRQISTDKHKTREISPDIHHARRISPERLKTRRMSPDRHKSRRISPDRCTSRQTLSNKQISRRSSPDRRKMRKFYPEDKTDIVIDKLPSYCTALALEPIPGMKMKKSMSVTNMLDTSIPCCDRDPSPERTGPVFDKVPAYFSCFTNSTKYDRLDQLQVNLDKEAYPWDKIRSNYSSNSSSRRQSPVFTVGDRLSRSSSNSSSVSRSRSPSLGRSWHRSGDRGSLSSPSRSRSSSSPSRSRSRSHSRSHRRHYRSRSRLHRSHSRSHHRSCSRSYRSRSRSHSRHRSRQHSRRRSKYRSQYRSRSRSRSKDRYWRKYREEMKVKREREKMQRIEERRIVYIGRIPNDMTKQLLRRTFEQFGDIEEVSVHFREHGDNYGFVTYKYTCDAYAAIERGNMLDGCEHYELCFGGRREFCKTAYADLDGDKEDEEEMGSILGRSCNDLDFDTLLKQATKKIKKC